MKIRINGQEKEVKNSINLKSLISDELKTKSTDGIAVALNYNVIYRQDWEKTVINEGDEIEIVTAMQGG
ncbi:MAG: sulfur carrier protein ThiS [Ignavibacteria bacterium]|nr:sulfur carrier protein ThiS [Ignavibacteria bacterium]